MLELMQKLQVMLSQIEISALLTDELRNDKRSLEHGCC